MVNADLPGVTAGNVSVEVENRVLVIKATKEKDPAHEDPMTTIIRCERTAGQRTVSGRTARTLLCSLTSDPHTQRRVTLPMTVDEDKVKVKFCDGVLRIAFEKHPVSRGITKKLAIST